MGKDERHARLIEAYDNVIRKYNEIGRKGGLNFELATIILKSHLFQEAADEVGYELPTAKMVISNFLRKK